MQTAKDLDYRTAVAKNLIKHKSDISEVQSTLNDKATVNGQSGVLETQDAHTAELASHASTLSSHQTAINALSNYHVGPAAFNLGNYEYVLVLGTDNVFWYRFYASGWSAWIHLQDSNWSGGEFTSSPAVSVDSSSYVHVYGVGNGSGTVADTFHCSFYASGTVQGWIPIHGLYPRQTWENLGGDVLWFS